MKATNPHRDPDTAMVMLTDGGRRARARELELSCRLRLRPADRGLRRQRHADLAQSASRRPSSTTAPTASAQDPLLHFFIDRYAESYARELDAFVKALDERRAPSIGFDDGRRALMIAEAAVARRRAAHRSRFPASRRGHAVFIEASAPTPNSAGACRGAIRRRPTTTRMTPTAAIISAISTEAYADA